MLSCSISAVEENLAATKPGYWRGGGRVKEFGGGAEKSHKNYLRAGKNAYERREEFILFPSSD